MRIAFITHYEGNRDGGSEDLWCRTALHLLAQGHKVFAGIFQATDYPELFSQVAKKGGKLFKRHRPLRLRQTILKHFGLYSEYGWLEKVKPDFVVISIGGHLAGTIAMKDCYDRRLPYAVIVQAASEARWPESRAAEKGAFYFQQAKAVYFVSQRNRELFERQHDVSLTNAQLVRNPFRVAYDVQLPWPPQEPFRMACVGRLAPEHKGQDVILEVLRLPKWRGRNLEVTFFGRGGGKEVLEKIQKRHKLEKVKFAGHVDHIEEIWKTHHMLLLSSRLEGLPLALVEAMLCRRPCLVTDVGGNTELIQEGVTGFIAKAPSPYLLDEAMEKAWNAREQWKAMGEEAGKVVRREVPQDPAKIFTESLLHFLNGAAKR
jgi:glycosyltransferase involved in cell wall biosynthesis